ncbi:hypothetical protein [Bathycoccus sp. RCC716 virus 1]|uniref:Uncharacterized protein n=1 Tax=Bathycoccus sp. RCC716 virus 1 TaxID=2530038 RepID=A0A7S6SWU1_9PHYC|nr:hypothetical protein [Bathycoccus sp. RCC716 virus 1]
MTLSKWNESVRLAKIKQGLNPSSYIEIKGKLLKEAQAIYQILLLNSSKLR